MIPKIIHNIFWEEHHIHLPEKYIQFKQKNPEWEFIMWNNKMILQLLEKYPKLYTLYKNIHTLSGIVENKKIQENIASYVILKEFGGVYINNDFICIQHLYIDLFVRSFYSTKHLSLNSEKDDSSNIIYIASDNNSMQKWLQWIWPFYKQVYDSSLLMAVEKSHPIWENVFNHIENATNKLIIQQAVNKTLQETNYPTVIIHKEYTQNMSCEYIFSREYNHCFINNDNNKYSWNYFLQFIKCYYTKFFLFFLVFIIILIVERINHYNITKFNINTFIPGITAPPSSIQTTLPPPKVTLYKKNKNRTKK